MTTCIGCGGHDAPSEIILCPDCWAEYKSATASPPLSESTRKALADFINRQPTKSIPVVADAKATEDAGA